MTCSIISYYFLVALTCCIYYNVNSLKKCRYLKSTAIIQYRYNSELLDRKANIELNTNGISAVPSSKTEKKTKNDGKTTKKDEDILEFKKLSVRELQEGVTIDEDEETLGELNRSFQSGDISI